MTTTIPSLIDGQIRESRSSEIELIPDPATGEPLGLLPHSTSDEIDEAVRAARNAFPGWADTPVPERAQEMFRLTPTPVIREERKKELIGYIEEGLETGGRAPPTSTTPSGW